VGIEGADDVVEVRVGAGDRRTAERAGQIAVLAVGGAPLGEVDAPVGAGAIGSSRSFDGGATTTASVDLASA
jgi:hypothetical protein